MKYAIPPLEYPYGALEPYIDAKTMEIHHTKHHQAYVDKLNAALEKHPELETRTLEDLLADSERIPEDIRQAVMNNGGGHLNHTFFWKMMSSAPKKEPEGKLRTAIEHAFGTVAEFGKKFRDEAAGRFGSGWAWLSIDTQDTLHLHTTANQDSPLSQGKTPIMGIDVWEHAYYLRYQNRRAEYIEAWWNVFDWSAAETNYEKYEMMKVNTGA